MAKQTFLNLSEDKRNMVVNALKKEFSRVPLKDALVSNIIIDAKIPRGSFYQYFNDIEDAFYYIIGEYSKDIKRKLLEYLEKNKGDIILSYRELYLYILNVIDNPDDKEYFENIFLNMNYEIEKMFTPNFNDGLNLILNHVDISKLNISSKFGLGYILDIIESIMMTNIIQSYKRNLSKEKNKEIFERELALVCAGILKK
jgi:AcrR family transcriptional regulator